MSGIVVLFETETVGGEEAVLREYLLSALDRIDTHPACEYTFFGRYGHDPSVDGGEIALWIYGDPDRVGSTEYETWEELRERGVIDRWWVDDVAPPATESDRLQHRLWAVASRMSVVFFNEFDESLPGAIRTGDTDRDVGVAAMVHFLLDDLGYQANDGEEEIDIYRRLLEDRLCKLGRSTELDRAHGKLDEVTRTLESLRSEITERRAEEGRHEHSFVDKESFSPGETVDWE